ncbi:MAG: hypothetical protein A2902_01635 [Elusimicrobia bacterium RIFCSPLOWO2_01_FULL_64_13]|nr:MAG: hypothetical protein A2902_01635 [Elusimicrobia bacterium RIFCSPLOWO2_01_FULL_64_13]
MLTKRIMVRLEAPMMDELTRVGESSHTPISILVRQAIWSTFGKRVGKARRATAKTPPRR